MAWDVFALFVVSLKPDCPKCLFFLSLLDRELSLNFEHSQM